MQQVRRPEIITISFNVLKSAAHFARNLTICRDLYPKKEKKMCTDVLF